MASCSKPIKGSNSSEDEWKPGDEAVTLAEVHGVKRKNMKKVTARKTIKISIKPRQTAAEELPKESSKTFLPLKDDNTTIIKEEYLDKDRDQDMKMMLFLGFPYGFVDQSISTWSSSGAMRAFLGCSCTKHDWFLTTRGLYQTTSIGVHDGKGDNIFTFMMQCRSMYWAVRVGISKSTGVACVLWRGKRPVECEPGFLPRTGPFVEDTLNRMYSNYFRRNYDRCTHENRCADMVWFDGTETEDSGSSASAQGITIDSSGVVSEISGPSVVDSVESARPKRSAAVGPKKYVDEVEEV